MLFGSKIKLLALGSGRITAKRVVHCSRVNDSCQNEKYEDYSFRHISGDREIVGHGLNGTPGYIDIYGYPFPAIRYRECTPELMALREKERGDWRILTIDERKFLYRASFRQTFAEMDATTSEWKSIVGSVLIGVSVGLWLYIFARYKVHGDAPKSFSPESRIAQYYRRVDLNMAPFSGIPVPEGAEPRVHPKNKAMLMEMLARENSTPQEDG